MPQGGKQGGWGGDAGADLDAVVGHLELERGLHTKRLVDGGRLSHYH